MLVEIKTKKLSSEKFKEHFNTLRSLILEEWKQVKPDALAETHGDLEKVIDYISTQTERTRTLVRRQLEELYNLADLSQSKVENGLAKAQEQVSSNLESLLERIEQRTERLLNQFEKEVLPEVNAKVRKNIGTSLFTTLGIGFILGLVVGGFDRGRE
ncbi:MAG: hypothetical protein KME16_20095 [Scytolyngbya sp. HA4215-MV1]|jgi:ElaB/YqjD/DUF883 family membrane-anchored ribosome-binding protein|nr:hypothetical protein [Scytolyngbya sp. HA4215-MV1]